MFLLLYGKRFKRFSRYSCYQRKKSRLVLLNTIPADRLTPFSNAAMETPQIIAVCVSRPVSMNLMIVSNCFIVFVHK